MNKKILTTYQVAEYCQVSPRTAIQWVNEGKLKAYRTPGNHSRVHLKDFLDFLNTYHMPVPPELTSYGKEDKKRVLIVDDDEAMADAILRALIEEKIYELQVAYDGFEAGRKFSDFKPDLVLLDIKMPGIDGFKVCANIRSNPLNRQVKIIFVSAYDEKEEEVRKSGADGYLRKPFNVEDLVQKLHEILMEGNTYGQK